MERTTQCNGRQRRFVELYVASGKLDRGAAYCAAFTDGVPSKYDSNKAGNLLRKPHVAAYLAELEAKVSTPKAISRPAKAIAKRSLPPKPAQEPAGEPEESAAPPGVVSEPEVAYERRHELLPAVVGAVRHSREWVLGWFETIAVRSLQGVPVLDKKGRPTGEWRFDAAGANTAMTQIAKITGHLIERKAVTVRQLSDLSLAEIEQRRQEVARQIAEEIGDAAEDIEFTDVVAVQRGVNPDKSVSSNGTFDDKGSEITGLRPDGREPAHSGNAATQQA